MKGNKTSKLKTAEIKTSYNTTEIKTSYIFI